MASGSKSRKRTASPLSTDFLAADDADAALAEALQLEEYGVTAAPKRQKLAVGRGRGAREVPNSTDDDEDEAMGDVYAEVGYSSDMGEPATVMQRRRSSRRSLGKRAELVPVIADSEDSALSEVDDDIVGEVDEEDDDDDELDDVYEETLDSSGEDEEDAGLSPAEEQQSSARVPAARRRNGTRGRGRRGRANDSVSRPPWMGPRVRSLVTRVIYTLLTDI